MNSSNHMPMERSLADYLWLSPKKPVAQEHSLYIVIPWDPVELLIFNVNNSLCKKPIKIVSVHSPFIFQVGD